MTTEFSLTTDRRPQPSHHAGSFAVFLSSGILVALLGALTTTPLLGGWFSRGPHADWTPQIWVFLVVWTVAYLADAVAGWLLWRRLSGAAPSSLAWALYLAQAGAQVAWLLGFMLQTLTGGTLLWVTLLLILILDLLTAAAATSAWRISRIASLILFAILAWELFGTALSIADTILRS